MLLRQHHQRIHRNADDDRRNAVEHVGREAHQIRIASAAELRHVNSGANAERHADQRAEAENHRRPTMALAMPPPVRQPGAACASGRPS